MTPIARALVAELRRHGIDRHTIEYGGKHPKLCFVQNGHLMRYVYPFSPKSSEDRNAVAGLRRLIRAADGEDKPCGGRDG